MIMNRSLHIARIISGIALLGASAAHADIISSDIQPGDLFGPWKLGEKIQVQDMEFAEITAEKWRRPPHFSDA